MDICTTDESTCAKSAPQQRIQQCRNEMSHMKGKHKVYAAEAQKLTSLSDKRCSGEHKVHKLTG